MQPPPLPKTFNLLPCLGCWLKWERMARCFWPGKGQRAENVDNQLAPLRHLGGIYLLSWSRRKQSSVSHVHPSVVYVGETSNFRNRMSGWGRSAGFLGKRKSGHSAAWRWKHGSRHLWAAFFKVDPASSRRLAKHIRLYYELIATEEFRVANGKLPCANEWDDVELG